MLNDFLPSARSETKATDGQSSRSPRVIRPSSFQPGSDLQVPSGSSAPSGDIGGSKPKKTRFWDNWSRRKKILVGGLSVLLIFAIGVIGYAVFKKDPPKPQPVAVKPVEPPKPTTVASPLTGVQVTPEQAARPVTAIMIENSTDARPQSGIADAGLIFEAIAEGGITRFMALFQEGTPQYVGPVRSLRPYYIDFAAPFQAGVAHVGGSPDALNEIRGGAARDLDQFANPGAYWRVSSRRAPHNMYTSFERLDALNKQKGFTKSEFTPWPRKEEQKLAVPTAKTITVNISSANYNSHYSYEASSNAYLRYQVANPHHVTSSEADRTGVQLRPKVVIVLVANYSLSGKYSVYTVTGSGSVYVFQDGGVAQGTWNKTDRNSQFSFKDGSGQPIKLNAGQAWVVLVRGGQMTYTP